MPTRAAPVGDQVARLYVASSQRAHENGSTLRLVLRVRPSELSRLPWEFLFQQDYVPGFELADGASPRDTGVSPAAAGVAPTLRILGLVARPGDQQALQVHDERRRLQAAPAGRQRPHSAGLGCQQRAGTRRSHLRRLDGGGGVQPGRGASRRLPTPMGPRGSGCRALMSNRDPLAAEVLGRPSTQPAADIV